MSSWQCQDWALFCQFCTKYKFPQFEWVFVVALSSRFFVLVSISVVVPVFKSRPRVPSRLGIFFVGVRLATAT